MIAVVPLAGTWIETPVIPQEHYNHYSSFPSRERGLKLRNNLEILFFPPSFPSRERGLKPDLIGNINNGTKSLPAWERVLILGMRQR